MSKLVSSTPRVYEVSTPGNPIAIRVAPHEKEPDYAISDRVVELVERAKAALGDLSFPPRVGGYFNPREYEIVTERRADVIREAVRLSDDVDTWLELGLFATYRFGLTSKSLGWLLNKLDSSNRPTYRTELSKAVKIATTKANIGPARGF